MPAENPGTAGSAKPYLSFWHTLDPAPSGSWRVLEAVGGANAWTLPPWSGLIARRLPR
jgi:hypothetical protein